MNELRDSRQRKLFRPARRQYFVNPRFQGRFIEVLCGLTVILCVTSALSVFFTVRGVVSGVMYRSHLPMGVLWQLIWPSLLRTNLILVTGSFLLAALAVGLLCRRGAKALRALEQEVSHLDTASPHASAFAWMGTSLAEAVRSVSETLQQRMQVFADAAGRLESVIVRWEKIADSAARQEQGSRIAAELDTVVNMVEETTRSFRY